MPRVTFLKHDKPNKDEALATVKEKAKSIYLTMPVVRLSTIAKRVGHSKDLIERWRDEDGWLEQRAAHHQRQLADLMHKVGTPEQAASVSLELCNEIMALMKIQLANIADSQKNSHHKSVNTESLNTCTGIVAKISELQGKLYKQLGV